MMFIERDFIVVVFGIVWQHSDKEIEAPTFSRKLAHIWPWGCHPDSPAALYPQEESWYSFLLEVESTLSTVVQLEGLGQLKNSMISSGPSLCSSVKWNLAQIEILSLLFSNIRSIFFNRSLIFNLRIFWLLILKMLCVYISLLCCLTPIWCNVNVELLDLELSAFTHFCRDENMKRDN
jgi:hypothetical protein